MSLGIETKYLPVTDKRGARIKAFTSTGQSVIIPFDSSLNTLDAHFAAVIALKKKLKTDWNIERMSFGGTKQGFFFCFSWSIYRPKTYKGN